MSGGNEDKGWWAQTTTRRRSKLQRITGVLDHGRLVADHREHVDGIGFAGCGANSAGRRQSVWLVSRQDTGRAHRDSQQALRALVRRVAARFEKPPVVPDAPGLVWKRHKDGWGAIWQARPDYVKAGYRPKYRRLALVGKCSPCEKEFIAEICTSLQYNMLKFQKPPPPTKRKKQKLKQEQEPTMEEILASIRRIIADDDASPAVTS
jgi:hypothetical protein